MASTEFVDPYLDPETGLLRNKLNARTKVALADAEGDLSFARLMQLVDRPPKATGDLDELRAIHRQLFQDVYEWAGELRTVDIRKNVAGAEFFLPVSMIERAAHFSAEELRAPMTGCAGWTAITSSNGCRITTTRSTTCTRSGRATVARNECSGIGSHGTLAGSSTGEAYTARPTMPRAAPRPSAGTSARCEACSIRSWRRRRRQRDASAPESPGRVAGEPSGQGWPHAGCSVRQPSVMTPERAAAAVNLREQGYSYEEIGRLLGVGKLSVARALAKHDERKPATTS